MTDIVYVCDTIMGGGKSSASIQYMNSHPDRRFIYITPYLDEAKRIRDNCQDLHFKEPTAHGAGHHSKTQHTAMLINAGRNITTTHQAFKYYTPEMLEDIRRNDYTLIIDENVDVLERCEIHPDDLQMAVDAGYIREEGGLYTASGKAYNGQALADMFRLFRSRELFQVDGAGLGTMFYWALPPELITSFRDVFILTYLFDGQSIHHFLKIYDIAYQQIGIERTEGGGYAFGAAPGYVPPYTKDIHKMLHILDNDKLNAVGDDYHALSMNWFSNQDNVEQIKKNVYNYFNNIRRGVPSDKRMWGSYNGQFSRVRGKGYTKSFVTFNMKATNAYRDRTCLVYISNLFMNVSEKTFYQLHGIDVDEDAYALSIMVQWIWRSAIRDGNPVELYIPSRRMRDILTRWMNGLASGGEKK